METTRPTVILNYHLKSGKYVMQFVYDTLGPDIADYLRVNNPNTGGESYHHQMFNDFGYKSLTDHLMSVLGIMKASINMDRFKENLATAFPHQRTQHRARLNKNRIEKKNALSEYKQAFLFDIQPNLNTIDVELEKSEGAKESMSDFNKKLKQALDYNPKDKNTE